MASLDDFVLNACAVELGLEVPDHAQSIDPLAPEAKARGLDLTARECAALIGLRGEPPRAGRAGARRPAGGGPDRRGAAPGSRRSAAPPAIARSWATSRGSTATCCCTTWARAWPTAAPTASTPRLPRPGPAPRPVPLAEPRGTNASRPIGGALRQEWRTPPLWGLRDSGPYLHDGRAATLEQAIASHGGEAQKTAQRFFGLGPRRTRGADGVPEVARRPDAARRALNVEPNRTNRTGGGGVRLPGSSQRDSPSSGRSVRASFSGSPSAGRRWKTGTFNRPREGLMVAMTILCIALLGAGPPRPAVDVSGALVITKGGSGGGGGGRANEHLSINASTADDFGAVVKHFQGQAGTSLANGSADGIDVIDDSPGRPLAFKVIARRWCDTAITAVIFRAEGDAVTHFDLIDLSRFGRDRPPAPRPFDPFDWTYPGARVVERDDGRPTFVRSRMTMRMTTPPS